LEVIDLEKQENSHRVKNITRDCWLGSIK